MSAPSLPPLDACEPRPEATGVDPARLLAPYPHVARCHSCRGYAADWLPLREPADVLVAALAHHDSGHRHDLLQAVSQHFAPIPARCRPFPHS
ncbi:MAG TPA: hypothetical protein VFP72_19120 [Kineosporiaceae bacterium]|nr:hypothetical protein [Kineosporiaceae bacterium]